MARADLHTALVLDAEIHEASLVDPSLLDPVVRVDGGLPGVARPLVVVREYQGPQGVYVEEFSLRAPDGTELHHHGPARVELSGEMFHDRFETVVRGLPIDAPDDHRVVFTIDDEEVGGVPVFVEAGLGGDPRVAAEETFKKALAKGAVLWVTLPGPDGAERSQGVWFVESDGKVYVLTGPGEQRVAGLEHAERVQLTARSKDARSKVAAVPARVRTVSPDDPLFDTVGRAGLGRRLNLPDGDGALQRWKEQCTLVELTPQFRGADAGV
ncbi:MAG: hypothetical protein KY434_04115 [Actinobacteria bacterium]|nr:hypothetical protein [Actinomycetota bacterium]